MSHPDEHVIVYEPNQEARAHELSLWQDSDKPRLMAALSAFAAGAQLAENTSWAVIAGGSVREAAEGETLDRWGELVGEERGGLGHEDYQRFIGLRIRVNTEHPGEQAMYEVVRDAVAPSTVSRYLVADGIVYDVWSLGAFVAEPIRAHTGALVRDFRPMAIYAAVTEQIADSYIAIGTVGTPGTTIGSISSPGAEPLGRLIYDGRTRG